MNDSVTDKVGFEKTVNIISADLCAIFGLKLSTNLRADSRPAIDCVIEHVEAIKNVVNSDTVENTPVLHEFTAVGSKP